MSHLWWRYAFQVPGLPASGDPRTAQVVAVQAFGRNTYTDNELVQVQEYYRQHGSDDLATLNGLWANGFDPGEPNYRLADECSAIMVQYGVHAIVQWEIAAAMGPTWYRDHRDRIICIWPTNAIGKPFTTRDVKVATVAIMRQHHWSRVIELAHRHQIVRAFLILRKLLGYDPIIVPTRTEEFDPQSRQKWTTSLRAWQPYNVLACLHHLVLRWV